MIHSSNRGNERDGHCGRRILLLFLAHAVLLGLSPTRASSATAPPPRVIVRFDVALLGEPNVSAQGGGGTSIPIGGTGVGVGSTGGIEFGAEVRHRWTFVPSSSGCWSPHRNGGPTGPAPRSA
jgi:hypothetical protein